jgi:hypothetical protein
MSIPAFLARLAVFAAMSALFRLAPDPASREMLFAVLIIFSVRRYFVWVTGGISQPGFQRRAEGFGARESLSA